MKNAKKPVLPIGMVTFLAYNQKGTAPCGKKAEVSVLADDIVGLEDLPMTDKHEARTRIDMRPPKEGYAMYYLVKQNAAYIRAAMAAAQYEATLPIVNNQ